MNDEISTTAQAAPEPVGGGLETPKAPTGLTALLPTPTPAPAATPQGVGLNALLPASEPKPMLAPLPPKESGITDRLTQQRDDLLRQAKATIQRYARGVNTPGAVSLGLPAAPAPTPPAPATPTPPAPATPTATPTAPATPTPTAPAPATPTPTAPKYTLMPSVFGDGEVQGYDYGGVRVELPGRFMESDENYRAAQIADYNRIIDMLNKAQEA